MNKKKIIALVASCILIAVSFAGCTQADVVNEQATAYFAEYPAEGNHMTTAENLFGMIDAGDSMVILDVRQADAYEQGHLAGAINVPYGMAVAEDLMYITNDGTPVYVYCYSGQTASQITALLNVAGVNAINIRGGFNNGIAATENYMNYVDTIAVSVPTQEYTFDSDIQAAITEYFTEAEALLDTDLKFFNIKPATLKAAIDAGSDEYYVLSVRQADAYAEGHIQGAVNIPFGIGMQENFDILPTDQKIAVYCYTGHTASQTVAILRLLGYDAYNMSGGMNNGWLPAGFEVVTD